MAVFGEYDISGDLETKRSVTKNVKRVIVHRQYDAATFENDLAILELESPVRYDSHIGNVINTLSLIKIKFTYKAPPSTLNNYLNENLHISA